MFQKAEQNHELDPLKCGTHSVSHIYFVDDLMVFLQAVKKNTRRLKTLLDEFSKLLGMQIYNHKSAIYFGGNAPHR